MTAQPQLRDDLVVVDAGVRGDGPTDEADVITTEVVRQGLASAAVG